MGGAMDLVASAGTKVVVTMEHSAKVCIFVFTAAVLNNITFYKLPQMTHCLSQKFR